MEMTIRKAIEEARKYGRRSIYTNNGTEIIPLELGASEYDSIGKIKMINGKKVYREIFCEVKPSTRTRYMDVIEKHTMYFPDENGYSYFRQGEYVIPERDMNLFINLNGGIDEYRTISVPYYMYSDTMYMIREMRF